MGYHIKNVIRGAMESDDVTRKNIALRKALIEIERLQENRMAEFGGLVFGFAILGLAVAWVTDHLPL